MQTTARTTVAWFTLPLRYRARSFFFFFFSTGADVPFAEFVAIDNDVPTCEPQSIAEIVAEVVGDDAAVVAADEAPEDGGEDEGLRPPATFAEALAGLEALQSFFRAKDNENADKALQCVQKELFLSKGDTHQQKITVLQEINVFCPCASVWACQLQFLLDSDRTFSRIVRSFFADFLKTYERGSTVH